jgi:glucosamine-6-phosphate deaminase
MHVLRVDSGGEAAAAAADRIARLAAERPEAVLGLPTGSTAIPVYDELARRHRRGALDLSRARGFNLDELVLPPGHPASFAAYMERHAWGRTGLDRGRSDIPDPAADPQAECRRYDRAQASAGGLDLAILGVGADGHVDYNLPGQVAEPTHVVTLPEALASALGVPADWRPLLAVTVGMAALLGARRVLVLATTADKAGAVEALVEGPRDPRWPCSLLRDHPRLEVVVSREVDRATAGGLDDGAGGPR